MTVEHPPLDPRAVVAPPEPEPVAAPRGEARPPATPRAPDPDIPFPPISLTDIARMAVEQGVDPETLPPATRAALVAAERTPEPDATPIRERALGLLSANLNRLQRIVTDASSSAAEVTAAMAQLARIADAYSPDGAATLSSRPLSSLTRAELQQRVAEIDTRRAQLLARIEAADADPRGS